MLLIVKSTANLMETFIFRFRRKYFHKTIFILLAGLVAILLISLIVLAYYGKCFRLVFEIMNDVTYVIFVFYSQILWITMWKQNLFTGSI